MFIQQGDVLFFSDELPPEAKRLDTRTIAEGESTGHTHVATVPATLYDFGGVVFVVAETETAVTHQEHGTVTLAPGTWRIGRIQEFDPFEEVVRNVAD